MNFLEWATSGRRLNDHLRKGQSSLKKKKLKRGAVCAFCKFSARCALIIHHLIPIAELGETHEENCIILCMNCHAMVTETRREWLRTPEIITEENVKRVYPNIPDAHIKKIIMISTAHLELAE